MTKSATNLRIVLATEPFDLELEELARLSGLTLNASAEREHEHATLLLAEHQGGRALGFVLGWMIADELEVVDIAVAVEARGQGIAQVLIADLFTRARAAGCQSAFLEVRSGNTPAQALYTKVGFERVGTRSGYYRDGEDAWLFRCCLLPTV